MRRESVTEKQGKGKREGKRKGERERDRRS